MKRYYKIYPAVLFFLICIFHCSDPGASAASGGNNLNTNNTNNTNTITGFRPDMYFFNYPEGNFIYDNPVAGHDDVAYDMEIQSDGNILVVGSTKDWPGNDLIIWRVDTYGYLDTTFNSTGILTYNGAANYTDFAKAVAIQNDGKIIVAGGSTETSMGNLDMFVMRLNPDGSLDTTFNTTGIFVHDGAGANATNPPDPGKDFANDIVIQNDGKIVIVGSSEDSRINGYYTTVVWRLNPDGTLDTTFNATGFWASTVNAVTGNEAHSVALQSDGKIVVAGYRDYSMRLLRFNPDGTPDTSFNLTGEVLFNYDNFGGSGSNALANDVVVLSDGKILVTGLVAGSNRSDLVVWRYNTDGSLDQTFAGNGFDVHGFLWVFEVWSDAGNAILVQNDGKYIILGSDTVGSMLLVRYNSDGSHDNTFINGGETSVDYYTIRHTAGAAVPDDGYALAFDSEGRLVIAGSGKNGTLSSANLDMVIWRYLF